MISKFSFQLCEKYDYKTEYMIIFCPIYNVNHPQVSIPWMIWINRRSFEINNRNQPQMKTPIVWN